MNILIIKLSSIGDVIHTLPALNAIKKQYPWARITWLVEEAASEFLKGHPALDRVIISRRKNWIKGLWRLSGLKSIKKIYGFIKNLRDTEYDLVIDFQGLFKSGILAGLSKGKLKAGYGIGMDHMEYSYIFLNKRVPCVDMNIHALKRNLMLINSLGIKADKIEYHLPVFDQDRNKADDLLKQYGLKGAKPLVAINPVARWETKLWSNLKFSRLADLLIQRFGAGVIFTGSGQDRKIIQDIILNMKEHAVNLAGETTLKTLAAIYKTTDFLVSTDTGPMHIAAATGTPVVALFGPTAPWRTGPFGFGQQIVRAPLECSPCFKRQCSTIKCMKQISVERVFEAASCVVNKYN